jgi:hypothetical protein
MRTSIRRKKSGRDVSAHERAPGWWTRGVLRHCGPANVTMQGDWADLANARWRAFQRNLVASPARSHLAGSLNGRLRAVAGHGDSGQLLGHCG